MSDIRIASFMKIDESFIPIEEFKGPIIDEYYVQGAIEWHVGGKIIDKKYLDYIDQLWCYIIQMLEKVLNGEDASTNWPDQPIKLSMKVISESLVLVKRSGKSDADVEVVLGKTELITSVTAAAVQFFDVFGCYDPTWKDLEEKEALERLEDYCRRQG